MRLTPNYSVEPNYSERHRHECGICTTPEYQIALKTVQRSGLRADRWGFLIHDIASHLLGKGPYVLTDGFVPDDY